MICGLRTDEQSWTLNVREEEDQGKANSETEIFSL